ncbi:hypothetical protein CAMRE0001_2614 [Campylobacter rectus RM3267]|uniref:Uncharacterized protein n=2 Tax=Campylobacter rectus TaxID=203 RepID=A0A6G5QLH2_CAMRE|nr:hypothetical protein [Campylobacter rectus]EEF13236.1 hypothetical protein CAMRE0001_2614 [Campylobacter rectus RM3267]QCD46548.1 hypothetical protein CRECT_0870 [Campylobacter rectus]UEB47249.1 hypothetical protein LK437_09600 [Campylobacter rectus]
MHKFTVKSKLKYGKFYLAEKRRRVKIRKFTRPWAQKRSSDAKRELCGLLPISVKSLKSRKNGAQINQICVKAQQNEAKF